MFHNNKGIAQIPELPQSAQKLFVVPLVQADAWFIQDIQNAHKTGADLGGEPDTLALAAGKRSRGPGQREISQANALQKSQSGFYFLYDPLGNKHLFIAETEAFYKFKGVHYGKLCKIGNIHAPDRNGQRGLFKPSSHAVRTGNFRHAVLNIGAHGGALRFPVPAFKIGDNSLKFPFYYAVALIFFVVELQWLAFGAIENGLNGLF